MQSTSGLSLLFTRRPKTKHGHRRHTLVAHVHPVSQPSFFSNLDTCNRACHTPQWRSFIFIFYTTGTRRGARAGIVRSFCNDRASEGYIAGITRKLGRFYILLCVPTFLSPCLILSCIRTCSNRLTRRDYRGPELPVLVFPLPFLFRRSKFVYISSLPTFAHVDSSS